MQRPLCCIVFCCMVVALLAVIPLPAARADWVEYNLPGTQAVMLIPVKETPKVLPGKVMVLTTDFGPMFVNMDDVVKQHKAPTVSMEFDRKFNQALAKKNASLLLDVAKWAVQRGMVRQFHATVDKALELEPTNAEAKRLLALRKRLDQGCVESSKQEAEMRKLVRDPNMKFKLSKHFRLMYDTPDKPEEGRRRSRAEERIDLLERVYEAFIFKFYSQGVDLEIPSEHLKVVLFNDFKSYVAFGSKRGDDQIASTAGFYEHTMNTAFFFDQGSHPQFEGLKKLDQRMQARKKEAESKRSPDLASIVNLAKSIRLLVTIERESQDVEVVSHEATHQLAANTGLLPRYVAIPSWVHEGLATYFESPNDSSWAGFGAVNEQRLKAYNAFAGNKQVSNIDFIVGNQIFDYARSGGAILQGYAQAWALTHFLMERHPDRFMLFYKKLGDMPPDVHLSAEVLTKVFNDVFSENRKNLDDEWHAYMGELKTDKERMLGGRW